MKGVARKIVLVAVILLLPVNVQAAAPEWQIDPVHSRIGFEIRHIFSSVYGYFQDYSGQVRFDPEKPEESSMNFIIDVGSIQTFIAKRDNHLRSPEFFDAATYPTITFASTSVRRVSDDRYDVAGTLTMKDVSGDIVLPFVLLGITDNPLDPAKRVAGFEARLTLDRLKYHVGDGKFVQMGAVGQEVEIVISLETLRDK